MKLDDNKIKRIHVNQHIIRSNRENDEYEPTITVKSGGKNYYGNKVNILGNSWVAYQPCKPLSCGATVWIETKAKVHIDE